MLARFVRLTLALELAAYLAIALVLHRAAGWSAPALVLAVLATALGARLFLVLATFALSGAFATREEGRLGVRATLRMVAGEWSAVLADNFFYLPFAQRAVRADPLPAPTNRIPVLLVHGYFSNRGYFRSVIGWLDAQGVAPVFAPDFTAAFAPIEVLVEELDTRVEEILGATGQGQLVLVCHSMGGLAARAYLCKHGTARVRRLVTIASPHHGTFLARVGIGPNARQMRRASLFLRTLCEAEAQLAAKCPTTSIYSPHDNLVAPQATSRLEGARNVAIPGRGHVDLLRSPQLFAVLGEELREAGVSVA